MENSYSPGKDLQRDDRKEQKLPDHQRHADEPTPAFAHAAQLLQSGAKLQDLSPAEAREVAATIGNQSVLRLLNGGNSVPLASAPPDRSADATLPETEVDVRWPILCPLPGFQRDGPLSGQAFSTERFRPMGRRTESGVIPDG